jgi:hypothetical protein
MPEVGALVPGDPATLGGYELVGRLGEGGQGIVFLARDQSSRRRVAIKLLHPGRTADAGARARFAGEVAAARQVAAFCTARVLDYDLDGDRPYVVSEYIDGPSLHEIVTREGPYSGSGLERLAVGTATALAAIHRHGVIHRDFKPANVLLGPDGPRVVDFGIARGPRRGAVGGTGQAGPVTTTGVVMGTPGYLAPEQFTGAAVTTAVDIFAWGVTMMYAALGRLPAGADTLPAALHRLPYEEPDLHDLPAALRDLMVRCLAKDPARRPAANTILLGLLGHERPPSASPGDLLDRGTRVAARLLAPALPGLAGLASPAARSPALPARSGGPGPASRPPVPGAPPAHGAPVAPLGGEEGSPSARRAVPGVPDEQKAVNAPKAANPRQALKAPNAQEAPNAPNARERLPGRWPAAKMVAACLTVIAASLGAGYLVPRSSPPGRAARQAVGETPTAARRHTPAPPPQHVSTGPVRIPSAYAGTWSGIGYQRQGSVWRVTITLTAGAGTGRVRYSNPCTGRLELEDVTPRQIEFTEKIRTGTRECIVQGIVTLTRKGRGMDYAYRTHPGQKPPEATARLRRKG